MMSQKLKLCFFFTQLSGSLKQKFRRSKLRARPTRLGLETRFENLGVQLQFVRERHDRF